MLTNSFDLLLEELVSDVKINGNDLSHSLQKKEVFLFECSSDTS